MGELLRWVALQGCQGYSSLHQGSPGRALLSLSSAHCQRAKTCIMTQPASKKQGFKKCRSATFSIDGFSFTIGKAGTFLSSTRLCYECLYFFYACERLCVCGTPNHKCERNSRLGNRGRLWSQVQRKSEQLTLRSALASSGTSLMRS